MTAFICVIQPEKILIAMDTLAVDPIDKTPSYYLSKFIQRPESNIVVAGTGSAKLVQSWFDKVTENSDMICLEDLDLIAPTELRSLHQSDELNGVTDSTVYHLGYSKNNANTLGSSINLQTTGNLNRFLICH
jgi:hypothetical protein